MFSFFKEQQPARQSGQPERQPEQPERQPGWQGQSERHPGQSEQPSQQTEQQLISYCSVNCGCRCPLIFHVRDNRITHTEPLSFPAAVRTKPCLIGRSLKHWQTGSADAPRLAYPQRRVGQRGEAKFERISWDEAFDTIANQLRRIIDTYGNEAIYINYGAGIYGTVAKPFRRLLNTLGGYLDYYGTYSDAQIAARLPYLFGIPGALDSSSYDVARDSDLLLIFGDNFFETRMANTPLLGHLRGRCGGCAEGVRERQENQGQQERQDHQGQKEGQEPQAKQYQEHQARQNHEPQARQNQEPQAKQDSRKIVYIDPRYSETAAALGARWIPLRPGTDAALVSGIAYVLITEGLIDEDFLNRYCVGYDHSTMPADAPSNASYKDYILGNGPDQSPKTPQWAAAITRIPAETIVELAHSLAQASAPFVLQGLGPQRHANGCETAAAICMLPILLGKIGLPGTNSGVRFKTPGSPIADLPTGPNPVQASISFFTWPDAILDGKAMTAAKDGVRGANKLTSDIKLIINYACNCLTNQHGDINRLHEILSDESKCEFIVVSDVVLSDSARYADILLPDILCLEQPSLTANGYGEYFTGAIYGKQVVKPAFDARSSFEVCTEIAKRLGVEQAFTQGLSREQWMERQYLKARESHPQLPPYSELKEQGCVRLPTPKHVGLAHFRQNPNAFPLATPSGRIEIYSRALAELARTSILRTGERIEPIPAYTPGERSYQECTNEYPLQIIGFHHKDRIHSSFGSIAAIQERVPPQVWINPLDAKPRNIQTNDLMQVRTAYGTLQMPAFVTQRILPGVVAIPQGGWHDAAMDGDRIDKCGCINTITSSRPTPLAKGNGTHSNVGEVVLAAASVSQGDVLLDTRTSCPGTVDITAKYSINYFAPACTGCNTCVLACADSHQLAPGDSLSRIETHESGSWTEHPNGTLSQDVAIQRTRKACPPDVEAACIKTHTAQSAQPGKTAKPLPCVEACLSGCLSWRSIET